MTEPVPSDDRVAPWRLSIDFGTSSTTAAVSGRDGRVFPLALEAHAFAIPSAVVAVEGELHTGPAATRLAAVNPDGYEGTPKRRIGEDEILLDGRTISPVTLVAAVLSRVYRTALRHHDGVAPAQVVLTHPEAWRGHRLERLRESAVAAGIGGDRIRLVSEPVAAAWHYARSRPESATGAPLAVLDFGGGTLDVALLSSERRDGQPRFRVIDQDGIDTLGGHDLDSALVRWTLEQLRSDSRTEMAEAVGGVGSESLYDRLVLRDQVRQAKHSLSEHASAPIAVRASGQEWVGSVTRDEFVALIGADLDRAVGLLQRLLDRCGIAPADLATLFLTGGSTLIPELHVRLERLVPGRLATLDDPKLVTCLGALLVPGATAHAAHPPARAVPVPATPVAPVAPTPATTAPPTSAPAVPPTAQHHGPTTHAGHGGHGWQGVADQHGPVAHQQGVHGGKQRATGRAWAIGGGAVGLLVVLGLAFSWDGGGGGGGDETTTPETDTTTTVTGEVTPEVMNADALLALVPAGAGSCEPVDATEDWVMVVCTPDPGVGLYSSDYTMYATDAGMETDFAIYMDSLVGVAAQCPDVDGVTTYEADGVAVGKLGCVFGTDPAALVWTRTDVRVLGRAYGTTGDGAGLWQWWMNDGLIGSR